MARNTGNAIMNLSDYNIDWDLVNELNEQAQTFDMEVDWETLTLRPKVKPKHDIYGSWYDRDNDPASPLEADWSDIND